MKTAVNNEVKIPMIKVNANPLIGPVPKTYKMIPVSKLVIFASMIADNAPLTLNPSWIDCFKPFFFERPSLILSKMITLASTDIPMVKMIPAIPGRVSTALKDAKIPKMNKIFTNSAVFAKIPALP